MHFLRTSPSLLVLFVLASTAGCGASAARGGCPLPGPLALSLRSLLSPARLPAQIGHGEGDQAQQREAAAQPPSPLAAGPLGQAADRPDIPLLALGKTPIQNESVHVGMRVLRSVKSLRKRHRPELRALGCVRARAAHAGLHRPTPWQ